MERMTTQGIEQFPCAIGLQDRQLLIRHRRRLHGLRDIVADHAPDLRLPERLKDNAVHVADRPGRQSRSGQSCIEGREIGWPELLELPVTEMTAHMIEQIVIPFRSSGRYVDGNPIGLKPVEVCPDRHTRKIDCCAVLRLRDQAGALDLCLPLSAGEAMPAALALARCADRAYR